jgi:hypothetical protein
MKYLLLAALVLLPINAKAYVSASGNDPRVGGYDVESKSVLKSEVATYSDAVSKGHALFYADTELAGAYIVSRYYSGTYNTAAANNLSACIASRDVATGDVAIFGCQTKGYVDYARYDATIAITIGDFLCIGTAASVKGVLVTCAANIRSPFVALETKAPGTSGTDLDVLIQSK